MNDDLVDSYQWHETLWQMVDAYFCAKGLPHAMLLQGEKGRGKHVFASHLAKRHLCLEPNKIHFCGRCKSCVWFDAAVHGDYIKVSPSDGKAQIGVEAVRLLSHKLEQTSVSGKGMVVVIDVCEQMNVPASNALLKILEEPPEGSLFLLLSHNSSLLPVTVLSRCQQLLFGPVAAGHINELVENKGYPKQYAFLLEGSPLLHTSRLSEEFLALREQVFQQLHLLAKGKMNPFEASDVWQKQEESELLWLIHSWLADSIKQGTGLEGGYLFNADKQALLTEYALNIKPQRLFTILDEISSFKHYIDNKINLNKALWLDNLAIMLGGGHRQAHISL